MLSAIVCLRKRGDAVERGDVLAEIHARDEATAAEAMREVAAAYRIGDEPARRGRPARGHHLERAGAGDRRRGGIVFSRGQALRDERSAPSIDRLASAHARATRGRDASGGGSCPSSRGEALSRVEISDARLTRPFDPDEVARELEGERVEAVDRRGKYLIVRFESGRSLLVHLRMTGSLRSGPGNRFRTIRTDALLSD